MTKMKILLAALVLTWPVAMQAETIPAEYKKALHTPSPDYPVEAKAAGTTGSGICQVTFGAAGHVAKATMLRSTGPELLDDHTILWAVQHWTGLPNTYVKVPITYRLTKPAFSPSWTMRTLTPPYPLQARAGHISGAGQVRAVFRRVPGGVSKVTMAKSTGSDMLDENTTIWARANWTGPPNTVPIAYRLQ